MRWFLALVAVAPVVLSIPTSMHRTGYESYDRNNRSPSEVKLTFTKEGLLTSKEVVGLCDDVKQYAG